MSISYIWMPLIFILSEAKRFGWRWVIAAVSPSDEEVLILDPHKAKLGREFRLAKEALIKTLFYG